MIDNSELLEHWTELFIGYLNGTLNEREAAEFEELARDPHFEAASANSSRPAVISPTVWPNTMNSTPTGLSDGSAPPQASANPPAHCAAGPSPQRHRRGRRHSRRNRIPHPGPWPTERERTLQLADAIYPAPDKVTLTLADGRKLQLDEQAEQRIEGVGRVSYGTEGVKYEAAPEMAEQAQEAPLYNELSVPEESKCLVTLEDGTRVWLNARSTLRYPVKFAAGERRVELSGEGLFDVTHNPERPDSSSRPARRR